MKAETPQDPTSKEANRLIRRQAIREACDRTANFVEQDTVKSIFDLMTYDEQRSCFILPIDRLLGDKRMSRAYHLWREFKAGG